MSGMPSIRETALDQEELRDNEALTSVLKQHAIKGITSTKAPKLKKQRTYMDITSHSAQDIFDHWRSMQGYFHVPGHTFLNGKKRVGLLGVVLPSLTPEGSCQDDIAVANVEEKSVGEAWFSQTPSDLSQLVVPAGTDPDSLRDGILWVKCQDGHVIGCTDLVVEGKSRQSAAEFANGYLRSRRGDKGKKKGAPAVLFGPRSS